MNFYSAATSLGPSRQPHSQRKATALRAFARPDQGVYSTQSLPVTISFGRGEEIDYLRSREHPTTCLERRQNNGPLRNLWQPHGEACPVNNRENGKLLVAFAEADPTPLFKKYKIHDVLGQYHSALEHTFIWIVDADDPHQVEGFASRRDLRRSTRSRLCR